MRASNADILYSLGVLAFWRFEIGEPFNVSHRRGGAVTRVSRSANRKYRARRDALRDRTLRVSRSASTTVGAND